MTTNTGTNGNPSFKLNSQDMTSQDQAEDIESQDQHTELRGPKSGSVSQVGGRSQRKSKVTSRTETTMRNLSSVVRHDDTKNGYETKKTVAQSCMNVALLAESAKNLKYLLTNKENLVFYMPLAAGLVLSIITQLAAACICGYLITLNVEQKERDGSGNETNRPGPDVNNSRWANYVSSCLILVATMINIIIGVTGFDDIYSNQFDF